jgi:YebC/PmpR family DNA-binding regulatory protein
MIVEKAKAENMPKDKIKNAIDKGAGRIAGAQYEQVTYEGFGPFKVAVMIECATDNRNRTNSEIKTIMNKNGGVLGSQGSVSYFFDRKGEIIIKVAEDKDAEELQLELIDLGAEEFVNLVPAPETHQVANATKEAGLTVVDSDVSMVPNTYIELDEKQYAQFQRFFEIIDDYEDVQNTYHNAQKKA